MFLSEREPNGWLTLCRGLGEIISLKFAHEGANVAINYVTSLSRAEVVAEKIKKEYGVKVILIQGVKLSFFPLQFYQELTVKTGHGT